MTTRLSIRSFAGTARTLVAVGIVNDSAILLATLAATPLIGAEVLSLAVGGASLISGVLRMADVGICRSPMGGWATGSKSSAGEVVVAAGVSTAAASVADPSAEARAAVAAGSPGSRISSAGEVGLACCSPVAASVSVA